MPRRENKYIAQGAAGDAPHLNVNYIERQLTMAQVAVRDPEIMHGTPVFEGTRVPVQTLFDYLEGGENLESFLEGFPTVSRDSAVQALKEAKELLLAAF